MAFGIGIIAALIARSHTENQEVETKIGVSEQDYQNSEEIVYLESVPETDSSQVFSVPADEAQSMIAGER